MARPYKLGRRELTKEETRKRILNSARELIMSSSFNGFSMEMVAKKANVARMTVYYQFDSKLGLMEAIFEDMLNNSEMNKMPSVFTNPDHFDALKEFITILANFWTSDRLLMRKLHSLARLDTDFEPVLEARENRRLKGINVLLERINKKDNNLNNDKFKELVSIIYTLTSFETFDTLAGDKKEPKEVTNLVIDIIEKILMQRLI